MLKKKWFPKKQNGNWLKTHAGNPDKLWTENHKKIVIENDPEVHYIIDWRIKLRLGTRISAGQISKQYL